MNLYQKHIALFGIVVPVVIAGGAVAGLLMFKSKMTASFATKVSHYEGFERNKRDAQAIEAEIGQKREFMERWEELVSDETASVLTSYINELQEELPSKEFMMTNKDHVSGKAGFANASAQKSGQIRLAFRANFRSMQRALVELESRMPQLQLNDMKINPGGNSGSLDVTLGYTAWEQ